LYIAVNEEVTVFSNKVLIFRPNTTHSSSTVVFNYTLQRVSAVQISYHQVDDGYTKRNMKGGRPVLTVL